MSKAYDRVEWCFLERMMDKLGFDNEWIGMIMRCLSSVSYSFIVNGVSKGRVIPGRGLRQGDALSPYIFLLCGEIFSRLISGIEEKGRMQGVAICRGAPRVSHLLFADESFIFCRAETSDCVSIQGALKTFELLTGQKINYEKSDIAFSGNVPDDEQEQLAELLGVSKVKSHEKYLGLPVDIGRSRCKAFQFLLDRMKKKTKGWKEKVLSTAGRDIMIKSVMQAIPSYIMNCFELPQSLCDEMHGMLAGFWWGDTGAKRKIHWLAWEELCKSKDSGGLGFRNLRDFNLALLGMQGWRIINRPSSLLARVLKARYFPSSSFMEARVKPGDSYTWQSLVAGRRVLECGIRYQVGDGRSILAWHDRWMPSPYSFKPFSPIRTGTEDVRVSYFIDQDNRDWHVDRLTEYFLPTEVDRIARIPISRIPRDDRLVWHQTKSGEYTVRSGYWVWRSSLLHTTCASSHDSEAIRKQWRLIWGMRVPPKVRVFAWKLLRNIIPTMEKLKRRHTGIVGTSCRFCDACSETLEHVFRDCYLARDFWSLSPIAKTILDAPQVACSDWLHWLLDHLGKRETELLFVSLWLWWGARNKLVWDKMKPNVCYLVGRAVTVLQEHQRARGVPRVADKAVRRSQKWLCPPSGRLKINIDGAYSEEMGRGGLGVIARNEKGEGIGSIARPIRHAHSALCTEAMACREGLRLGISQDWRAIEIESDCCVLVDALLSEKEDMSYVSVIIDECKVLMKRFADVKIRHIFREANGVANRLARLTNGGVLDGCWLEVPPDAIVDVLFEDVSNNGNVNRGIGMMSPPNVIFPSFPINDNG